MAAVQLKRIRRPSNTDPAPTPKGTTVTVTEERAVWVEQVQDKQLAGQLTKSDVERIVDECAQLGATKILWLLKARVADTASVLWYDSAVGPAHPTARNYDGLDDAVELAHQRGIEVHAYFSVFPEGDPAAGDLESGQSVLAQHPEWAVVDMNGKPTTFVCAGQPGYREYLHRLIDEVLDDHSLDGIHLDFIRYPRAACFCARCLSQIAERFQHTRDDVIDLIETRTFTTRSYDDRAIALHEADSLIDYYCQNVHDTVQSISHQITTKYSGKQLSAAVFPNIRSATSQVYCDWVGFSRYLDFVCPMVYWYSEDYFQRTVDRLNTIVSGQTKLLPGISALGHSHTLAGKNDNFYDGTPDHAYVKRLIERTREIGTGGFALFHHAPIFGHAAGPYTTSTWGAPMDPAGLEGFLSFLGQ